MIKGIVPHTEMSTAYGSPTRSARKKSPSYAASGLGMISDARTRPWSAYCVEKRAARRLRTTREKIDFSDRSTNRLRASIKGKRAPENLARSIINEFFNTIGQNRPLATLRRVAASKGITDGPSALALVRNNYCVLVGRMRWTCVMVAVPALISAPANTRGPPINHLTLV